MKTTIIAAMTLCGRISPAPLGSATDRAWLEKIRDDHDVSLIGAATLRQENPRLHGAKNKKRQVAVISASTRLPPVEKPFFTGPRQAIIFTSSQGQAMLHQSHGHQATIITLPQAESGLDLRAALAYLASQGHETLLIEGGGRLNFQALSQGVVDEVMVTITPQISGARQAATLASGDLPADSPPPFHLRLLDSHTAESGEIFTHYKVIK